CERTACSRSGRAIARRSRWKKTSPRGYVNVYFYPTFVGPSLGGLLPFTVEPAGEVHDAHTLQDRARPGDHPARRGWMRQIAEGSAAGSLAWGEHRERDRGAGPQGDRLGQGDGVRVSGQQGDRHHPGRDASDRLVQGDEGRGREAARELPPRGGR